MDDSEAAAPKSKVEGDEARWGVSSICIAPATRPVMSLTEEEKAISFKVKDQPDLTSWTLSGARP